MCGIAGVFKLSGAITVGDVSAVLEMLDAQFHRGPDDWGLLLPRPALDEPEIKTLLDRVDPTHVSTYPATSSAPGVVLGSRRLAIIDRSFRGRMPMGTEHDERWVVLNGEIYNHRELRAELEGVATFRSHSDSEVLLQGWSRWGDGVAERLRGMFAFALFEALPRPRLVLGRDRLGIKPLYTWGDGVRVVFASEVRALLVSGLVPSEANPEALLRFLELGSVPAPLTTMKDVQPLPEGELAHVDARGMSRARFWDLGEAVGRARATRPRSFEEAVTSTRAMLEESMRLHLVSDVPVGAFLSGGVDSASMVALAAPQLERPMTTLTVTFDEAELSEAHYARMVAERYRTDHREVRLQPGAVFDDLPQMFAAMDQPTVDGLNVWCVSRAARDAGLRVGLSPRALCARSRSRVPDHVLTAPVDAAHPRAGRRPRRSCPARRARPRRLSRGSVRSQRLLPRSRALYPGTGEPPPRTCVQRVRHRSRPAALRGVGRHAGSAHHF